MPHRNNICELWTTPPCNTRQSASSQGGSSSLPDSFFPQAASRKIETVYEQRKEGGKCLLLSRNTPGVWAVSGSNNCSVSWRIKQRHQKGWIAWVLHFTKSSYLQEERKCKETVFRTNRNEAEMVRFIYKRREKCIISKPHVPKYNTLCYAPLEKLLLDLTIASWNIICQAQNWKIWPQNSSDCPLVEGEQYVAQITTPGKTNSVPTLKWVEQL